MIRKTKSKEHKKKLYDNPKRNLTSLKENPVPISVPTNKVNTVGKLINEEEIVNESPKEETEMIVEPEKVTDELKEIDLSVIAQPSIRKSKAVTNQQRIKEILNSETNEPERDKSKESKHLPSTVLEKDKDQKLKQTVNTKEKMERHINLVQGIKPYDIHQDLNKLPAEITLGQLLDICPKLRAQLNKALRLKNISHSDDGLGNVVLHAISLI